LICDAGQKGKARLGEAQVGASTAKNGLCQLLPRNPGLVNIIVIWMPLAGSAWSQIRTSECLVSLIQFGNPILNKSSKIASAEY